MFNLLRRSPKEPESPWRRHRSDGEYLTLDDGSGYAPWGADPTLHRVTIPQMAVALFNNARSAFTRNVLRRGRRPPPPELDEHGFPVDWRVHPDDPFQQMFLEQSAEHWPTFEAWCNERMLKPFPATEDTVLRFLLDPPVEGQRLYATWAAINSRHEAFYWMEDANPTYLLRYGHGVDVKQDGTVIVPDEARQEFGL